MAGDELESEVQAFIDLRLSAATSHERASAGDPLVQQRSDPFCQQVTEYNTARMDGPRLRPGGAIQGIYSCEARVFHPPRRRGLLLGGK